MENSPICLVGGLYNRSVVLPFMLADLRSPLGSGLAGVGIAALKYVTRPQGSGPDRSRSRHHRRRLAVADCPSESHDAEIPVPPLEPILAVAIGQWKSVWCPQITIGQWKSVWCPQITSVPIGAASGVHAAPMRLQV